MGLGRVGGYCKVSPVLVDHCNHWFAVCIYIVSSRVLQGRYMRGSASSVSNLPF